jgi:nicotinamide riboside kinase
MAEEYDTLWVHEFGRELWEAQDLKGSFADHLKMARRQVERERAMARHARRYLFCDTNAWTTLQWCIRSYGVADERLHRLVNETLNGYTWVMCGDEFGWIQDGTRELEGNLSRDFQRQQERDLLDRGIEFYYAEGSLERRQEVVRAALGQMAEQRLLA